MKKSTFYEFAWKQEITSFNARVRVKLQDGTSHDAVWITGLPNLDPSVDGQFEGIIGDERQVFYLFDERRYAIWPVSQIESMELLQSAYLAPAKTDFLRELLLEVEAQSEMGKGRKRNGDNVLVHDRVFRDDHLTTEIREEPVAVFAVSDGLDAHPQGDLASKEVLQHLATFVGGLPADATIQELEDALRQWATDVHRHLLDLGKERPECQGMGATVCGLLIHHGRFLSFHAGNSRLYHLRKDELIQITHDPQPVPAFSGNTAQPNLANCLGACENPFLEVQHVSDLAQYDTFLLCTDGLGEVVKTNEIKRHLVKSDVKKLAKEASRKERKDDVSVVMVRLLRDVN